MADQINLRDCRQAIDRQFVGFDINGPKVKPVHIINGILRAICEKTVNTEGIKQLSYVESKKGVPGYSTDDVMRKLIDEEKIEDDIDRDNFESFRRTIQLLLDADSAVFDAKQDRMISYTLSSKYFLTKFAMYEGAGEFIGDVVKQYCPSLSDYITSIVDDTSDPLSLLFFPVSSDECEDFTAEPKFYSIASFRNPNKSMTKYIESLSSSGACLLEHLRLEPNRFIQLRIFNFFCIYQLFRYLASLEAFYCGSDLRTMLLDFTNLPGGSVAAASQMSYAQIHKSLSRFYAWGYSEMLADKGLTSEQLLVQSAPIKQTGTVSADDIDAIESLWDMAKLEAKHCDNEQDARMAFGMAIYNMLSREVRFHPANYLRALGVQSGLLYPPNSSNNRFAVSQDILEMILMCTVEPKLTVTGPEIRERLFERLGIIIGGSVIEDEYLNNNSAIMQVDSDALEHNFNCFASELESLGFAELMADGILQIHLGGSI